MSILEITLTTLTAILTGSNFLQFFSLRSMRRKMDEEANKVAAEVEQMEVATDTQSDAVLYKRIAFLDERVERLEKMACFDRDCKLRK